MGEGANGRRGEWGEAEMGRRGEWEKGRIGERENRRKGTGPRFPRLPIRSFSPLPFADSPFLPFPVRLRE
jgi:hypothetical protein